MKQAIMIAAILLSALLPTAAKGDETAAPSAGRDGAAGQPVQAKDGETVLRIYNWDNHIDPEVIADFEFWYKRLMGQPIHVDARVFEQPEDVLERIESGEETVDAFCPPEYIVERMLRRRLLQPIDTAALTLTGTPRWIDGTSAFIDSTLQRIGSSHGVRMKDYTVGYIWGNTGVLVNTAHVKPQEVESWGFLFDPKFKGRVWMKDSHSDLYNILICYDSYQSILSGRVSRNLLASAMSNENIAIVDERMRQMRPQIAGFEVEEGMAQMAKGRWWLNVTWNGDARRAIQDAEPGVSLAYVVPKEGSDCWIDCWVIPRGTEKARAATLLINFLYRPENAIRTMRTTGNALTLATPEVLAELTRSAGVGVAGRGASDVSGLSDLSYFFGDSAKAVRVDPVMFPDISVISRCCLLRDSGERQEVMREMWDRWRESGTSPDLATWLMLAFVALLVAVLLYCLARRRRRSGRLGY